MLTLESLATEAKLCSQHPTNVAVKAGSTMFKPVLLDDVNEPKGNLIILVIGDMPLNPRVLKSTGDKECISSCSTYRDCLGS